MIRNLEIYNLVKSIIILDKKFDNLSHYYQKCTEKNIIQI